MTILTFLISLERRALYRNFEKIQILDIGYLQLLFLSLKLLLKTLY